MKKNINIKKLRDKIKPLLLNAVITFHASESLKFVEISSLCKRNDFLYAIKNQDTDGQSNNLKSTYVT